MDFKHNPKTDFKSVDKIIISSVSSNTDFVIAGKNPGSKLEEAKQHNIKI